MWFEVVTCMLLYKEMSLSNVSAFCGRISFYYDNASDITVQTNFLVVIYGAPSNYQELNKY